MHPTLENIRHVALDLDGTVYTDGTVFDSVEPFLAMLDELEIGHSFLTNNSSRSTRDYVDRLRALGIAAQPDQVYTSGDATIEYLRKEYPKLKRMFLLGTPSLAGQFEDAGYTLCNDSHEDVPELVVVGFDTGLVYSRLCRAAYWIAEGVPYVATHPDRVCPTNEPTILVDCGAIIAALEQATGKKPLATPGKPDRRMLDGILVRHGLQADQLAMIGDRLYTDMVMAREAGSLGIMVLTGETTADQVAACDTPPPLVVRGLDELTEMLRASRGGRNA